MEFKQYPSYKPSGVEWLGDVPEHWEVLRFRDIASLSKGLSITKENLQDEGIPCVNYGEIHSKYGFEVNPSKHPLKCVSVEYKKSNPQALLAYGDFVFADTSEDLEGSGNFTYLSYHALTFAGYHTVIARPKPYVNVRYLAYFVDSENFRNQIRTQVKGIKVFSITQGILKNIYLYLPDVEIQYQIASFLNTETTRIDNLIAKQEKLIELLEEQRKSIISHAVSKGLNPNAPMKDSGVEWLGDVPEHWEVISIKFLAHCSSGQGINSLEVLDIADDKNSFPVIGGNGMMGWTSKSNYKEPVLSIGRVGALCGNVHLINYPSWISDNSLILKVYSKKVNLEILQYILLSRNLNNLASKSAQPLITGTQVKNEKITLPPPNEQSQILQYIIQNQSRINNLIAKQKTLIEKLKEYRASIISHAVTGKIDVREFGA